MRLDILLLFSLILIGIGLISCSPYPNPTPTLPPTLYPPVTLTIYLPEFVSTLSPQSTPSATILPPAPSFEDVLVQPPACYPLPPDQITCLGIIRNGLSEAIGDISLQIVQVDQSTTQVKRDIILLEQRIIAAGQSAPYRIQFADTSTEASELQVGLESANIVEDTRLPLLVSNIRGDYVVEDNIYTLSAAIINPTALDAERVRVVITLENENKKLIAYRVLDISAGILSGESDSINVTLTPREATSTIRYHVTVEAFASASSATPSG